MRDVETSAVRRRRPNFGWCATKKCKFKSAARILSIWGFIILEREISYKILCLFST